MAGSRAGIPDPCHQIQTPLPKDYSARWNGILSLARGPGCWRQKGPRRCPLKAIGPMLQAPKGRGSTHVALQRDSIRVCQMKKRTARSWGQDLDITGRISGLSLLWTHALHREATGRQMRSS